MAGYPRRWWATVGLIGVVYALFALTGCVNQPTTPTEKKAQGPVFFPAPPEPPRYQFLKSFWGPKDFAAASKGGLLGSGEGEVMIKKPFGVVMRNGVISLADTTTGVYQFDLVNKQFLTFKGSKGLGKIVEPINLSADKENNIFVCDPVRKQVMQYDKNDIFMRAFTYAEPWKPVAAQAFDDKLYVADATKGTGGVKVFDLKSGKYLETIGLLDNPEQRLGIVTGIAFDKDGYLYAVDVFHFGIMKYDRDGHFRGKLGGPGDSPGYFGRPRGIAVDRAGRVYVVDAAFDVVQVFANTGQMLTFFGNAEDTEPGALTLPAGIFLDYDNIEFFKQYAAPGFEIEYLILVSSQFNKKQVINVYGYGKMQGVEYKSDRELYQEMLEKAAREKGEKGKEK